MSTDKHPSKAEVFAGWLDGRVHLHQRDRDAIAAELRRLSASEAALVDALERAEASLTDYQQGIPFGDYDSETLSTVRAAIASAKEARNG